jgi:hypothetical protein
MRLKHFFTLKRHLMAPDYKAVIPDSRLASLKIHESEKISVGNPNPVGFGLFAGSGAQLISTGTGNSLKALPKKSSFTVQNFGIYRIYF